MRICTVSRSRLRKEAEAYGPKEVGPISKKDFLCPHSRFLVVLWYALYIGEKCRLCCGASLTTELFRNCRISEYVVQ